METFYPKTNFFKLCFSKPSSECAVAFLDKICLGSFPPQSSEIKQGLLSVGAWSDWLLADRFFDDGYLGNIPLLFLPSTLWTLRFLLV